MTIENGAAQKVKAALDQLVRFDPLSSLQGALGSSADGDYLRRDDVVALIRSMLGDAQLVRTCGENLNGGMHASIFAQVWGDAGGGDAGRCALAEYAFDLGVRSVSKNSF